MDNPQEPKPKGKKTTLIAIIAVVVVVIVIGSVLALDPGLYTPKTTTNAATQKIFVYSGPGGQKNSEHLLGGDVIAAAQTNTNSSQNEAMYQFMAYMMSGSVQQQYLVHTGFIPVDNYNGSSSGQAVHSFYSSSNATISLTYYDDIAPSDSSFVQGVISQFEHAYPNINVHYVNTVATSILSSVESHVHTTSAIVMSIDNLDVGALVYGHYLKNLNNTASKINPATTISSITNLTNYETQAFGGIFFLTERVNIPLVWINYSAMQKAGINTPPTTDAQLLQDAKTMYTYYKTGMVNFQGHGGASTATELYQWFVQAGGNPMVFNDTGDIQAMQFIYNLSKYFSPEYKTSYWATYKGLASNKYTMMDYQWPGSVNLTALGMQPYNASNTASNASATAIKQGVFLRTPVPWISEWQTLMDNAWTSLIVNNGNYSSIAHVLGTENAAMYNYLLTNYNYTVAQNYENGTYAPIVS